MHAVVSLADRIHSKALEILSRYKRAEVELIEVLQQVEEHRVFIRRGYSSLFQYVVTELGLSESVAYSLIAIARKSQEIPELKQELQSARVTLSNARRIVSVLTPENQAEWITKARNLSTRALEKEIVKADPKQATRERFSYVTPERVRLEIGLSEGEMESLKQVQDLLSQSRNRPVTLEETIQAMTSEYLRRHDPVERAKRQREKRGAAKLFTCKKGLERHHQAYQRRLSIPARILHQVNLRDQRRCTHILPSGQRCNQPRWIEIHHKVPVGQGGDHTLENLITLCSSHHKLKHLEDSSTGPSKMT